MMTNEWKAITLQARLDVAAAEIERLRDELIGWQPIETCPAKPLTADYYHIAKFWQPVDDDGVSDDTLELVWAHRCYFTHDGWMLNTTGFKGLHGNASFPVHEPTHWSPDIAPPAQQDRSLS